MSYTSPEQLTLKHRFKQSWTAFNRLLPALKSTSLTQQQKLKIWKACAYATLTYGLDCTGVRGLRLPVQLNCCSMLLGR